MKQLKNLTVEELREVAERKIAKVVYIADRFNLRKANGSLSYYINLNEEFAEKFLENVQDTFFDNIREEITPIKNTADNIYEKCNDEIFEELDQEQLIQYIDTLEDYSYELVCYVRNHRNNRKELNF